MKTTERYRILDRMLKRPQGATFDEICEEIWDYDEDQCRQDRKRINDKLRLRGQPTTE